MQKDFDTWNELKKQIEKDKKNLIVKQGEIWWCNMGVNVRTESCGKGGNFRRPVLILKKLSGENFIVIPLSTKIKTGTWFANYIISGIQYTAFLYQIKMVHVNRLYVHEGKLDRTQFVEVKKRLKSLLNL